MYSKPKILIAGGSGLLGLNWAVLIRNNFDVILGLHERVVHLAGVRAMNFSFDSYEVLCSQINQAQPNLVINAIGLANVEMCESEPHLANKVNVILAENIAKVCNIYNIPFAHISTDHLFSGNEKLMSETATVSPLNEYAETKARAEKRILEKNPSALIVRTNFYGWGTSYRQSFSDRVIKTLRSGREISLFGDVFYTPILIEDLVYAVHDLIELHANGVFNIVGESHLSKYDFGMKLAHEFNLDARLIKRSFISNVSGLVRRPKEMSLDNRKAKIYLGRTFRTVEQQLVQLKKQELNGLADELGKL